MKKLVIGFSKPKKWMPYAWIIQKLFQTSYDHVYIRLTLEEYNKDIIYQASKLMVNFMGLDIFLYGNDIVKEYVVEISDENYIALMQFAIDNACKPYGILDSIGIGLIQVAKLCGFKIKNPYNDHGQSYICSELAGYIIDHYTSDTLPIDINDLSPKDIYDYFEQLHI